VLKKDIDLRRVQLKKQIDDYYSALIKQVDQAVVQKTAKLEEKVKKRNNFEIGGVKAHRLNDDLNFEDKMSLLDLYLSEIREKIDSLDSIQIDMKLLSLQFKAKVFDVKQVFGHLESVEVVEKSVWNISLNEHKNFALSEQFECKQGPINDLKLIENNKLLSC
jgi:hypothetical protein